jgi:hypothetical protein
VSSGWWGSAILDQHHPHSSRQPTTRSRQPILMHPSISPLASIFRLNTELVLNCIEDLDDRRAQARGEPPVNSIAFLVAHLSETRHLMAQLMGELLPSPSRKPSARRGHWSRRDRFLPSTSCALTGSESRHTSPFTSNGSTLPSWPSRHPKGSPVPTALYSAPWHSWRSTRATTWARSGYFAASWVARR